MRSTRTYFLLLLLLCATRCALASLCAGTLADDRMTCCTLGCGQSRVQCAETHDVCEGRNRGDATTKANCCPSAIRKAAVPCSAEVCGFVRTGSSPSALSLTCP